VLDRPAALDVGMPQASTALLTVLTIGVGVLVANLYYAQPLIASIGAEPAILILIGCLAALASPCELGLDMGRRF